MNLIILNEIKKKWVSIFISGIVVALLIIGLRVELKQPVMVHGPIKASVLLSLDGINQNTTDGKLRLDRILGAEAYIYNFIQASQNTIQWDKINVDWDVMDNTNRIEWYKRHFYVKHAGSEAYEIYIDFKANDAQDPQYVVENLNNIINVYLSEANKIIQQYNSNYSVKLVNRAIITNDEVIQDVGRLLYVKYGIVGFVLGTLLSIILVSLNVIRKQRNDR